MAAVAIPIIVLGSLYILSEQEKKKNPRLLEDSNNEPIVNSVKENFSNYNNNIKENYSSQKFNQHTDKYFNDTYNQYSETSIDLLSGHQSSANDFKHNNMQPYFGGKIRGATNNLNTSESILDNKLGIGSQSFNKVEQAPLFRPDENVNYINGTPNNSDFFQSRMNESMKISNVSMTQPQQVGPGLNLGYGTQDLNGINTGGVNGDGGFNSGMMARETWMPKNVDELRVDTNQKQTFDLIGHQGPAINAIKSKGIVGKIEKHNPDTYYENTPNRWFTTTGIEKNHPIRSTVVMPNENRQDTTREYYGPGTNTNNTSNSNYVKGNYEDSKKINLESLPLGSVGIEGMNNPGANDHGINSYTVLNNNRNTTKKHEFGGAHGMFKAVVSPLMDILNPTRKENAIGNIRQNGNFGPGYTNTYITNYNDKTKVTNREMTTDKIGFNHLNFQGQGQQDRSNNISQFQPVENQRATTNRQFIGTAGSSNMGIKPYNSVYDNISNIDKTTENRMNHGSTQIFSYDKNIEVNKKDKVVQERQRFINGGTSVIPSSHFIGEVQGLQEYENLSDSRLDGSLLTAFKNNPYTQSLQSL